MSARRCGDSDPRAWIVVGRRVAVFPKRRDSWHKYANLWGAAVGRPGVLKTPAIQEMMRPLRESERAAAEANAADMDTWLRIQAEAAIRREASKKKARKAADKNRDS